MAPEALVCNKVELAEHLKCSLPTLDALLRRYGDDFPVRRKGSNGIAWEFVLADVIAFLKAEREAEQHAADERAQLFEQFRLPLDELAAPEAEGMTPQQRASLALARQREHELALQTGQVVLASEMVEADRRMWKSLGRFLDSLPNQLARLHNLPDPVVRSMRAMIDEQRRLLVRELGGELLAEAQRRDGTHG